MIDEKMKHENTIYIMIVIISSILLVLKLFITTENSFADETQYITTAYRFFKGDIMLVQEWSVVQTSSLLLVPFWWIWDLISGGSNDGVILYFRVMYLLFKLFVLLYSLYLTKDKPYKHQVYLAGLIYYFFTPQNIEAISYNTLGLGMIYLVIVMILVDRGKIIDYILCGLAFTVAAFVHPYNVLLYPAYFFVVLGFWVYEKKKQKRCEMSSFFKFKGFFWFSLSPLICVSLVIIYFFSQATLHEVMIGLKNTLTEPDHVYKEPFLKGCVHKILHNIDTFAKDYIFVTLVNGMWCVMLLFGRLKKRYFVKSTLAVLVFSFMYIMIAEKSFPMNIVFYAFFWFSFEEMILFRNCKIDYLLCILIAFGYSIAVSIGTNTGVISAGSAMASIGLISVVLWEFVYENNESEINNRNRIFDVTMFGIIIICTLIMRVALVWTEHYSPTVYSARIERGPMKGTWTKEYVRNSYYRDLDAMDLVGCNENDILLCGRVTPAAYLYSRADIGVNAVYFFHMNYEWLDAYYELNPTKVANVIYYSEVDENDLNSKFLQDVTRDYTVYDLPDGFLARKK